MVPFRVSFQDPTVPCTPHCSLNFCTFRSHDASSYTPPLHKCRHQAKCKCPGPWANWTQIPPVGSHTKYVDWTHHMFKNTCAAHEVKYISISVLRTTEDYHCDMVHTSYFNPLARIKTPHPSRRPSENIPLKGTKRKEKY